MQKLTALLFPDRTAADHSIVSLCPWGGGRGSGKNVTASCKRTKASQRCAPIKKNTHYCPLLIFGWPYPGKAQQPQGQRFVPVAISVCSISPVAISVCAVFRPLLSVCVQYFARCYQCVQYFARCYQCVCSISPIAISVCSISPVAISVCSISLCPDNATAASVGIVDVRTHVDAGDCTRGLYGHRKRVCTESRLWETIPCRTRDSNPRQYCTWLSVGRSTH